MYNFNDVMVCAEPYVNLKRVGIIVGILPFDMRGNDEQMTSIIYECLNSDTMEKLISGNSKINSFFFDQVMNRLEKYYDNIDMDCVPRVFHFDGCTIFAIECSRFYQYHGTVTWKQAALKYTNTVKFNRACNRLHNNRRFSSDLSEYDFLVNVIELGSIGAISTIAEMHQSDLTIQAFYRAALARNAKSTMQKCIAPTYKHVIDIRCKLVQRWGINENILEVFDRPVVSLNSFKEFSIEPKNTPVFNGFTAKDVLK